MGPGSLRGQGRAEVDAVKIVALFLVSLAMVACAPPYLADLDRAILTRQMTEVGTAGPVNFQSGLSGSRFLPAKPTASSIGNVNLQAGFVVIPSRGCSS